MRRIASVLIAILGAAWASSTAQAQQPADPALPRPSQVRDLPGTVVYSRFDPAIGKYRLELRSHRTATTLPVAPQAVPFEADLGTNTAGRPQVIFAADGGSDTGRSGGQDLFVMELPDGAVRPVRNANTGLDERTPTLDEGRIAFTRVYDGDQHVVYTKRLVAPRERPSTRLPGLPQRRNLAGDRRGPYRTSFGTVDALELEGTDLGQLVTYRLGSGTRVNRTLFHEARWVETDDRSSRLVAFTPVGEAGQYHAGLSFADGYLSWYRGCEVACAGDYEGALRYRPGVGYDHGDAPRHLLGYAWTGEATWQLRAGGRDCDAPGTPDVQEPCTLVVAAEPEWKRVRASSVRR